MSACGSLQHIFENPLPENPTLFESLSWDQIKPAKSLYQSSSFTEIFGELQFKESPELSSSSSPHFSTSSFPELDHTKPIQNEISNSSAYVSSTPIRNHTNRHKSSDSFSSLKSESLQLCTESLGFESSDDVEDMKTGTNNGCWQTHHQIQEEDVEKHLPNSDEYSYEECFRRSSRVKGGQYPPPISCLGRTGKPWVCFRSYRENGRFVLKEIRIPTREFLHAYREDGRLKLQFVQPDDEFLEEEEEKYVGDEEENGDCVTEQVNEEKETDA